MQPLKTRNNASSDPDLFEALKANKQSALNAIFNRYWKPLYISAYNFLKEKELSEDMVQEVFYDLWRNREKIEITTSLKSYLYACVRYKVFNEFRRNKNIQKVTHIENLDERMNAATPESKVMHKELIQSLEAIVSSLPSKCQQVYRMSREEQLSHKEISVKLEISTKTIENHMTKALKAIKNGLGKSLFSVFFL